MPVPTPPAVINHPNGTIELKGNTLQPYIIDNTRKYRIITACNQSNLSYNGKTQNGTTAYKGSIIEVTLTGSPLPSTIQPTGTTYSVFNSADFVFTWDENKLEFLDASAGFGVDPAFLDFSKFSTTILQPGVGVFHCQVLPAPELRTPPATPSYYQWNLGGYLWASAGRAFGKLRFRVKSDFYFPTQQPTDIKIVAEAAGRKTTINQSETLVGEIQNNANQIKFGPTPEYKVSHILAAPTTAVAKGQEFGVKILATPETLPQLVWSVSTIFAWDNTLIEFMGIDKTGAKASVMSTMMMPGAGTLNETAIPKDGNAQHTWLCVLGDKTPISAQTLIATLKFKAIADFTETTVELCDHNDPRFAGLTIVDECAVLGSVVAGTSVTGQRKNAVVKGIL